MITLWNPADEAQDLTLKLFFSGGHYLLPIHLDPRVTRTINISEVTQNSLPDSEGNTIPSSIHDGSAKITGSHADNEIILIAMDAGVYNVRKATCGTSCFTCDGYSNWQALLNTFVVGINQHYNVTLSATYDNGGNYNFAGTWSSNNTSIASVGSSTGTTTGVSPGSTYIAGSVANSSQAPVYLYYCSNGGGDICPVGFGGGGQSSGTVPTNPTISGVTPGSATTGSRVAVVISGSNFGPTASALSISGIPATVSTVNSGGTQIGATFDLTTLGAGSHSFTVNVITDGGNAGSNSWPFTVNPVQVNTAEITVIGWINAGLITLPSGENTSLQTALNVPGSCDSLLAAWAAGTKTFVSTSADVNYANAFLVKYSGNAAPATTINPATQLSGGDFRLFNDVQVSFFESNGTISSSSSTKSTAAVGSSPDPCGVLPKAGGQNHPNNGYQHITPSATGVYQLAEGRIGTTGQAVGLTLNGRTAPWIWNVIEFDASGNPTTSNDSIFPSFSVYKNGTQIGTYAQGSLTTFIALDATYQLLPSQIQ